MLNPRIKATASRRLPLKFKVNCRRFLLKAKKEVCLLLESYSSLLGDGASVEALALSALQEASEGNAQALVELCRRLYERNESLERALKTLHSECAERERMIENRYKQLLEAITDYTFSVTVQDGKPIHTKHSENCVAITGYTSAEYEDNPALWYEMIYPDDRAEVLQQIETLLRERRSAPLEHRIFHKSGSVRWVKNTPVVRLSESGEEVVGYDGLISDITERKEAELALRESEERFRFIVEQSPVGIALISLNNRILKVNATICNLLGYTEQELTRLYTQDITVPSPESRQEKELVRRLLSGEVAAIEFEKRYYAKSGDIIWVNVHSSCLRDASGKALVRVSIVENLTPRKKAEEALRTSEERLRALMQNANDAVVITDSEAKFTYLSPSVARIFYYAPDMMLGRNAFDFIHPDDAARVQESFRRLVELPLNAMQTMQYRFRRADGSWAELEAVSTNLLKHRVIRGVVTNARDISNRHRQGQDKEESGDLS
jgi:PAS domain S-box-containing protein